ncbi:kanadaptin [Helicoverpa armigera]|uniref:kanadaptin n=1 Tax=Helicoverpa armigera TaxID=29058 RepID=UPI003083AF54
MEETSKEPKSDEKIEFKKPVLFGRIGKLPKKVKNDAEKAADQKQSEKPVERSSESSSKSNLPPAVLLKELSTPIPYKEPKWSGICPDGSEYALEVLKSGMIVDNVDLTHKPYYVFGRLANCDVVMAHPTISRHHAVLQYKAFAEEGEPPCGWYLYDLASTHGTFLNKDRLKASHYTRVRVGHQIKFGNSTRTYIMLGPDFDCEGESELSVTEIKRRAQDMKLERDRMIQEAVEQRERNRKEEEKRREEQGIDWGMGEDAEEEPDLAENPYAVTANEELYLEDPKKTLRGYFEREGHELNYNCDERGVGQFICRVELPIDDARGNPVVAEVIHRGKKKEAVIACALEACRILDRAGLLRQSKHESRRRKERDWSADDFYDSDDDTFLDRTGSVERKRKLRMQKLGAAEREDEKPRTYDDLLKEITDIEKKISSEEATLEKLRSSASNAQQKTEDIDELDLYMNNLGKQGQSMAQKAEISKTKMNIQKLKMELSKTQRLAEIARPAHLPPLVKKDDKIIKQASNSAVYGKRIRLKEDTEKKTKIRKEIKQEDTEFVEEVDSDDEAEVNNSRKQQVPEVNSQEEVQKGPEDKKSKPEVKSEPEVKKVYGPMRPPENYVIPESYFDQESDRDLPEIMEKE